VLITPAKCCALRRKLLCVDCERYAGPTREYRPSAGGCQGGVPPWLHCLPERSVQVIGQQEKGEGEVGGGFIA